MNEEFFNDILKQSNFENLFLNVLLDAKQSGHAVEVLTSGVRDSKQLTGFVEHVYPDTVHIRKVDEDGDDDGVASLRINRIRRIQQHTRALCRTQFLREQKMCGALSDREYGAAEVVDGIYAELEIALATGEPIECWLDLGRDNNYVSGLVQRLNGDFCQMLDICYDGDPDGLVSFKWRDINSIERDTPDLQRMMALYHARHYVYDKTDPQG